jgi:hypothetical protein
MRKILCKRACVARHPAIARWWTDNCVFGEDAKRYRGRP